MQPLRQLVRWPLVIGTLAVVVTAGCGGDDSSATSVSTTIATDASGPDETTASAADADAGAGTLDTNGDGKVQFGVATAGPRNDGAYYEALVEKITAFTDDHGYAEPIVVDSIKPEEAATQLDALARQGVDVVMVGSSELREPLNDLIPNYPETLWYCNCGGGFEDTTGRLIQTNGDSAEISYSAGYATGLLMRDASQTKAAFLGSSNLPFEIEAFQGFELGLKAVDPAFSVNYVATGSFNDVAAATEAFNNVYDEGARAIYSFLGGAHESVVELANEAGDVIVLSAGASDACTRDDLDYDIQVKFDAGDYVDVILQEMQAETLVPGSTRTFRVGVDPQVGADICDPTPEQTSAMEELYTRIASAEFADAFDQIRADAYGG